MGNAVRFRRPTRRKNPFKIFIITLLIVTILAISGHFAYIYFSVPDEPEVPEIIYIIEEKDVPAPTVAEEPIADESEVTEIVEEVLDPLAQEEPSKPIQTEETVNEVDN